MKSLVDGDVAKRERQCYCGICDRVLRWFMRRKVIFGAVAVGELVFLKVYDIETDITAISYDAGSTVGLQLESLDRHVAQLEISVSALLETTRPLRW